MKRFPESAKVFLTLIRPTLKPGRSSFSLLVDVRTASKREQYKWQPKQDEDNPFTELTKKFKDELKKGLKRADVIERLERHALVIKSRIEKELGLDRPIVFSTDNLRVLDSFFETKYTTRKTKDKRSAYNDYRRAIESIGLLPIESASVLDIQKALSKFPNTKQRRLAGRLQQLLRFTGRNISLEKDKLLRPSIHYLTHTEFKQVLKHVKDTDEHLIFSLLFHSGLRIGELFGTEEEDFRAGVLAVKRQMLRPDEQKARNLSSPIQDTKTSEMRRVVVFKEFDDLWEQWAAYDFDKKFALRGRNFARSLKEACLKVFPKRSEKHCVVHDLRHSFAIRCINQEMNLTSVAQQLGNRVEVAQAYYAGYTHTDESIELAKAKLR